MTTQARPSFDRALADQVQHTKNAQALADDYKRQLDAAREQLYLAKRTIAALERRLAEAQQGLTVAEGDRGIR